MNVSDFDYDLPENLVAQEPLPERDGSKLLVLDRTSGDALHRVFSDLPELLREGDLLVLNDTRVIPARVGGRKTTGGRVDLLFLERTGGGDDAPEWICLARASKPLRPGQQIELAGSFLATVIGRDEGTCTLRLDRACGDLPRLLERIGRMPLPPYIRRGDNDPRSAADHERYQTVFARSRGALAAPTAGLHFTPAVFGKLDEHGIETAFLTLHTGPGTFLPVRTNRVENHTMHPERFAIPEATAEAIARARARKGRIVAVGTTVVRTLEAIAAADGIVRPCEGFCDLFIHPGFTFRVVDAMVTNFHLPRSTLLMLVSAFAGFERVLRAYREAIAKGYRFYSYGDAMLVM